MKGRRLIVALLTVFSLGVLTQTIAVAAAGAEVTPAFAFFYVQHRTYQDGTVLNRLAFGFKDATSGALLLEDKLESVTLFDPDNATVAVPEPIFSGAYEELDGEYDGKTGIWYYGTPYPTADYKADLEEELIPGTYKLIAIFDGKEVNGSFNFSGVKDLPIIPGSSIKSKLDASGNLICTWAVSYDLSETDPWLQTSARVIIDIKKKGKIVGNIYYRVPTHLGRLFVPKAIVDAAKSLGNSYLIQIQMRTNDQGTRTYSNPRKLVLK